MTDRVWIATRGRAHGVHIMHATPDCSRLNKAKRVDDRDPDDIQGEKRMCDVCTGQHTHTNGNSGVWQVLDQMDADDVGGAV